MDRAHDESTDAEVGAEDTGLPTESNAIVSDVPTTEAGGRPAGGVAADPSGIDDPANLNAFQGEPRSGGADGG
jgi:hypothetical protein